MEITIRALTEADLSAFKTLYTETILSEFKEYTPKTLEYFTQETYFNHMWNLPIKIGAFAGDQLVGYILSDNPTGGVAFVHWLAIGKEYQHKGIGKKLVDSVEMVLEEKGAHSVHLQAAKHNIPFYEKCGYSVYGFDDLGYFGAEDYHLRKIIQQPREETFFA